MDITEAILNRRSIRSFKPDPIPKKIIKEILEISKWSPSGSNTQPWEVAVLGGKMMEEVKARIVKHLDVDWDTSTRTLKNTHPDIPYPDMPEPYISRQRALGQVIDTHQFPIGTKGIDEKRVAYRFSSGRFFGAPTAFILYVNKEISPRSFMGIGMFTQTVALTALKYGLGTCIMSMVTYWPEIYRDLHIVPEDRIINLGIAIGYPDMESEVNSFPRKREPLESFVHWYDA